MGEKLKNKVMYYIYEIPGVKIGCTSDFERRQKEQKNKGKMILLESYEDINKASERERELQRVKGYGIDTTSYFNVCNKLVPAAQTTEAKTKKAKTQSKQRKGKPVPRLQTPEARKKSAISNSITKKVNLFLDYIL